MKLLALSLFCSFGFAATIPTKTPVSIENNNGKRFAAGLAPVKPKNLYNPGNRVLAPRASAYPASGSSYILYGCVDSATIGTNGGGEQTYTTMEAAQSYCSDYTDEEGDDLVVVQDSSDVPTSFFCAVSPGTTISCDTASFVYYSQNDAY